MIVNVYLEVLDENLSRVLANFLLWRQWHNDRISSVDGRIVLDRHQQAWIIENKITRLLPDIDFAFLLLIPDNEDVIHDVQYSMIYLRGSPSRYTIKAMSSPLKEHVFSNFSCMNLTSEAEAQAQCIQDNWECKLRFHYRHQADLHGYSRSNVHRVHMKQLAQVIVLCLGITELEEIARICSTFVPFFPLVFMPCSSLEECNSAWMIRQVGA